MGTSFCVTHAYIVMLMMMVIVVQLLTDQHKARRVDLPEKNIKTRRFCWQDKALDSWDASLRNAI